jgi:GT2 family glycosyltransferase
MKTVSVISVNYNHSAVTEAMLESIIKLNAYPAIEVIVVDNGSRDNPVPGWKAKYPQFTFIRSEANLGFAGGNNLGIAAAKGEYLFLANNDTEFTPTLVGELAAVLDNNPQVGMVSPKIKYFDKPDLIQYVGFTPMDYYTCRNSCVGQFETDAGQYDHMVGPTGFAHGAAMMVRKAAVDKAGRMAENYFLYYEEMDWCDRIRKAGYDIWVDTDALIYHKESVSVGAKSALKEYFMNRNRLLFIRRNCSLGVRAVFLIYFLTVVVPRNVLVYIKDRQWKFIPVLFRAVWWNLTNGVDSNNLGYTIKR